MKSHRVHTMLLAAVAGGCATQPAPEPEQPSPAIVVPVAVDEHEPVRAPAEPAQAPAGHHVQVVQDERVIPVSNGGSASIHRGPFALRFIIEPYTDDVPHAVRLVAHAEPSFTWPSEGVRFADGPPFGSGFGMAAFADGYRKLFIQPGAFHYLMYQPGAADQRVRLVTKQPDGRYEVEMRIPQWTVADGATAPTDRIQFGALFDDDHDQTLDAGELVVFDIFLIQ